MTLFDLILIAVSLSMDAFAVSICKGLSVRKVSLAHALTCGVWFGGFQFLMPTLGYFLGDRFATLLTKFGPWVAFVLLALIGANMVKESFGGDEQLDDDYSAKAMLPLAIATSIDAFAVGVSFAAMQVAIISSAALIGITTCLLSAIGVKVGALFGDKYRENRWYRAAFDWRQDAADRVGRTVKSVFPAGARPAGPAAYPQTPGRSGGYGIRPYGVGVDARHQPGSAGLPGTCGPHMFGPCRAA